MVLRGGPSADEVAELIAEGISTPVVTAGSVVLAATRPPARDSVVAPSAARAVEPTASATSIGLSELKNFNSLEALTAPLSAENVTAVQGLLPEGFNEFAPVDTKDPISPDRPLNAPLDPGDVAGSRNATRRGVAEALGKTEDAKEGTVDKASASGAKLVVNDKEEGPNGLTEEEHQKVEELKRRDAEVRAHEQAHAAVGGAHAGAPRFRFVRGPDGKFYAVAGEVTIDTSAVPGNPQATIRKMQQVKRAALAPQEPSAQDRRVAAEAERKILQARQQIREQENERVRKAQEQKKRQEA